jgi:hypothetical protein
VSTIPITPAVPAPSGYTPFSDFSLQRALDRAVQNIPAGNTFALVAHVDNDEGASLSLFARVGDHWTLKTSVVKGWQQPFKYGAEVMVSY